MIWNNNLQNLQNVCMEQKCKICTNDPQLELQKLFGLMICKNSCSEGKFAKKIAGNNDLQNLPKIYQEEIYMITTNVCSHDLSYINFPFFRLENIFSFVVKRMEIIYHIWDTNSERHKSLVSDKKGTAVKACRRNGKHH